MDSILVREALRKHYRLSTSALVAEEWCLLDEVPTSDRGCRIDMLAIRAWAGGRQGHERHAIEIKVSRSDFLREVASGKWRTWFPLVHRFFFAAPAGLITLDELPEGCGLKEVTATGVITRRSPGRRDPGPLPEHVVVELARRASRAMERQRRQYPLVQVTSPNPEPVA